MKTILYIPTLNAGSKWREALLAINNQTLKPAKKIIIDSGSTDETLDPTLIADFEVIHIDKRNFDHGGTRQMAINKFPDADIYIFLTQDAILADNDSLKNLVKAFDNPSVGVAYGRQLPHKGAKALEAHPRLFNYPTHPQLRSLANVQQYGIKTISCSNSFAAYRKEAFLEAGGFPSGTILGEDVIAAGNILLNNWQLAYISEAAAYHSHDYTIKEEFKRYFDIGVFHATNRWIFDRFGHAESEGLKYAKSELIYVTKHNVSQLPKAFFSIIAKWFGYRIGLHCNRLPTSLSKRFSMHKAYWLK